MDESWASTPTLMVYTGIIWDFISECVCVCVCVGFVKGDRVKEFPTLQVRYKKGANPTLKLLDDTNTVQDTLA